MFIHPKKIWKNFEISEKCSKKSKNVGSLKSLKMVENVEKYWKMSINAGRILREQGTKKFQTLNFELFFF